MQFRFRQAWRLAVLLLLAATLPGLAETPGESEATPPPAAALTTVPIGYLKQEVKKVIPLSRLNVEPEDLGIAGAEIALKDNNTTGRFTKQQFTLEVERVPVGGDAVPGAGEARRERPPLRCSWMRRPRPCCGCRTRSKARTCCCSTSARRTRTFARKTAGRTCCIPRRTAPCSPMRSRNISSGRSGSAGWW